MASRDLGTASDDQNSTMVGAHGDLTAAYKASYARHSTSDGTSYGVGVGSPDSDNAFSTHGGDGGPGDLDGDTGSDTSGYGKGIAGEYPMVTRGEGSDNGSGFGKAIG